MVPLRCKYVQIFQSNQSITRDRKKNPLQQEQTFFLQCSSLFLHASVYTLAYEHLHDIFDILWPALNLLM